MTYKAKHATHDSHGHQKSIDDAAESAANGIKHAADVVGDAVERTEARALRLEKKLEKDVLNGAEHAKYVASKVTMEADTKLAGARKQVAQKLDDLSETVERVGHTAAARLHSLATQLDPSRTH